MVTLYALSAFILQYASVLHGHSLTCLCSTATWCYQSLPTGQSWSRSRRWQTSNQTCCLPVSLLMSNSFLLQSTKPAKLQQFGSVYLRQASPEKCYATGKGLETASLVRVQQLLGVTNHYPQHYSAHARYLWSVHDIHHMMLSLRPSRFSCVTFKSWEWSGDKATWHILCIIFSPLQGQAPYLVIILWHCSFPKLW